MSAERDVVPAPRQDPPGGRGPDPAGPRADVTGVAGALRVSAGLLVRRLRQVQPSGELTMPENSALVRLSRGGPASSAELARQEQISPQSMGATLSGLEARGLIERRADPKDGRRIVLSVTDAGEQMLASRRDARTERLARALAAGFTPAEIEQLRTCVPLIERLAQAI